MTVPPFDLHALAASSRPATIMRTDERHAAAIFDVLSHGDKMLVPGIMEACSLTYSQFRSGWTHLRRTLGVLAVVEPHGRKTTYALADGVTLKAHEYLYWQGKHAYSRLWSIRATLGQMIEVAGRTDDAARESLRIADMGVADAITAVRAELRRMGTLAQVPVETVEKYLVTAARNN